MSFNDLIHIIIDLFILDNELIMIGLIIMLIVSIIAILKNR